MRSVPNGWLLLPNRPLRGLDRGARLAMESSVRRGAQKNTGHDRVTIDRVGPTQRIVRPMAWAPYSRSQLQAEIDEGLAEMTLEQRRLWDAIAIPPEKWQLPTWGDEGGGFWAVALYGKNVIWFNDIEHGFNRSRYEEVGRISEYRCNQDMLHWTMQRVLEQLQDGQSHGHQLGAPQQAPD
jgi:hypothetical protein